VAAELKVPAAKIYFPEEDIASVLQQIAGALRSGQLTLGPYGKELERRFAEYVGARYAIAVNSGTSAIEIPLRVLGVEGKQVLVPTNTFFATPAAVMHAGGRVKFVDADPDTLAIDVASLKRSITKDTVGVIAVHIGGMVTPRMPEIVKICKDNGLFLFEDAAHAHGSSLNGQMAGTFGIAAAFSFYPTKVMTSGEGGIIVTNEQRLYEDALIYRDQGKAGFLTNFHTRLGYNWRLSEPHAIMGLSQFKRLEEFIAARNRVAGLYDAGLSEIAQVKPLAVPGECRSNYYKYVAVLDRGVDRSRVKKRLRDEFGVALSGEVYDTPCHRQPVFETCRSEPLPKSEDMCARHICLPVFATMTDDQAKYVLRSLSRVMKEA